MALSLTTLAQRLWGYLISRGHPTLSQYPNIIHNARNNAVDSRPNTVSTQQAHNTVDRFPSSNPSLGSSSSKASPLFTQAEDSNTPTIPGAETNTTFSTKKSSFATASVSKHVHSTMNNIPTDSHTPSSSQVRSLPPKSPAKQAFARSESTHPSNSRGDAPSTSSDADGPAPHSRPAPTSETYQSVFGRYLIEEQARNTYKTNMGADYKGTRDGIDYYHAADAYPRCGDFGSHVLVCGHWIEERVMRPNCLLPANTPCGVNCVRPNSKYNRFENPAYNCPQCFDAVKDVIANRLTPSEKEKLEEAKKSGVESFIAAYAVECVASRGILKANITETVMALLRSNYGRTCKQESPRFPFATPGPAQMAIKEAEERAIAYCSTHSIPVVQPANPTTSPSARKSPGHQKRQRPHPVTLKSAIPQKRDSPVDEKDEKVPDLSKKPMWRREVDRFIEEEKMREAFMEKARMKRNKRKAAGEVESEPAFKMGARKVAFGQTGWDNLPHAVEMSFGRKRGAEKMDGLDGVEWGSERDWKKGKPKPVMKLGIDELDDELDWIDYLEEKRKGV